MRLPVCSALYFSVILNYLSSLGFYLRPSAISRLVFGLIIYWLGFKDEFFAVSHCTRLIHTVLFAVSRNHKRSDMCYCCICCTCSDLILYIFALLFPPVAVLFRSGCCSSDFLLNILLTLLGFLPGLIHAWYYISITSPMRKDTEHRYYYQQGWTDSQRHNRPPHHHSNSAVVRDQPAATTPLLVHSSHNSHNSNTVSSGKQGGTPCGPPPPYTETV